MNLLVHMDARGTSSVYPHLGITSNLFYEMAWAARRGSSRRLPWAWPLLWARLRSATFSAPPVIRVRPRATPGCRLGRFRNSESVKVKGKQNVLHSCVRHGLNLLWNRLVVRMTGLIAATSPLPESTAFHNGVIQATRGCAARPCDHAMRCGEPGCSKRFPKMWRVVADSLCGYSLAATNASGTSAPLQPLAYSSAVRWRHTYHL